MCSKFNHSQTACDKSWLKVRAAGGGRFPEHRPPPPMTCRLWDCHIRPLALGPVSFFACTQTFPPLHLTPSGCDSGLHTSPTVSNRRIYRYRSHSCVNTESATSYNSSIIRRGLPSHSSEVFLHFLIGHFHQKVDVIRTDQPLSFMRERNFQTVSAPHSLERDLTKNTDTTQT